MIIPNTIATDTLVNSDILPVRVSSHDVSSNGIPRVMGQASEHEPSPQQIRVAVGTINQIMQQSNQSMEISVDFNTKIPVVKLTDTVTGELIRQMPSKEILAIAHSIDQFLKFQSGLLLNHKA